MLVGVTVAVGVVVFVGVVVGVGVSVLVGVTVTVGVTVIVGVTVTEGVGGQVKWGGASSSSTIRTLYGFLYKNWALTQGIFSISETKTFKNSEPSSIKSSSVSIGMIAMSWCAAKLSTPVLPTKSIPDWAESGWEFISYLT